jgi:hypothetical protein
VEALYKNVLGMNLDATNSGVQYWVNDMDTGVLNGAGILISFTNATTTMNTINAASGATAGTGTGWLINYEVSGGYADPGAQESVQAVLAQEATSNYLNTALINPSTVTPAGVTSATDVTVAATNGTSAAVGTWTTTPPTTIVLSGGIAACGISNDGDTVISAASGGDTIGAGGSNTTIVLHGTGNALNLGPEASQRGPAPPFAEPPAVNNTVTGYVPGNDQIIPLTVFITGFYGTSVPVQVLTPTAGSPVNGASLNFGANAYVLNLGNVGDGSAASVAAAMNSLYIVADKNGNDSVTGLAGFGENLTVFGQAGSDTVIYQFATITVTNNHPGGIPLTTPDVTGTHQVAANEIELVATLLGVHASSLTAHDF